MAKPLNCRRCGYVWEPRQAKSQVTMCPKCKSKLWNQPLDREPDYDQMRAVLDAFGITYEQWNCEPAERMDPDNPAYSIYTNARHMIQTGAAAWELFDKNYRYLGYKVIMSYHEADLNVRLKQLVAIHKKKPLDDARIAELTKNVKGK